MTTDFTIALASASAVGERIELRVAGSAVEEMEEGGARRTWMPGNPVAACAAFERRLAAHASRGLGIVPPPDPPWADAAQLVDDAPDDPVAYQLLAEAMRATGDPRAELVDVGARKALGEEGGLAERERSLLDAKRAELFGPIEEAAQILRGTFAYEPRFGFVHRAWLADADDVGLSDALMPPLLRADPRELGFDPRTERLAPHTLAVHALRRVLLHPAGRFLRELRLEVVASLQPFVEALDELGRTDRLTHLTLLAVPPRPLGRSLFGLRALACSASRLERCLGEPLPVLESLTVGTRTRDVLLVLGALAPESLPSLHHLGLRGEPLDVDGCERCLDHPLLAQLDTLDLGVGRAMPEAAYALLSQRRRRLEHLTRLVLPAEGVAASTRQVFAGWPNVLWADRRRQGLEELDRRVIAGAGFGGFTFTS